MRRKSSTKKKKLYAMFEEFVRRRKSISTVSRCLLSEQLVTQHLVIINSLLQINTMKCTFFCKFFECWFYLTHILRKVITVPRIKGMFNRIQVVGWDADYIKHATQKNLFTANFMFCNWKSTWKYRLFLSKMPFFLTPLSHQHFKQV